VRPHGNRINGQQVAGADLACARPALARPWRNASPPPLSIPAIASKSVHNLWITTVKILSNFFATEHLPDF
jgi:hypothetical protein